MPIGRGIRKVNENLLVNGRGVIVTEQDKNQYNWSDIPVGSKLINTINGLEYVKLEGQSDWVPSKIKNDGTLSIAKDSMIIEETFIIQNLNSPLDDGNEGFTYKNQKGQIRHMPKTDKGYVFELEDGEYFEKRNHIEVFIDDVLRRNSSSGGLTELSSKRFAISDTLYEGQEITARYIMIMRIGNPYPRWFLNVNQPDTAEIGDFWMDYDDDPFADPTELLHENDIRIPWENILGKPTTIAGYGITDNISYVGHKHKKADITDFPTTMRANGGNCDTVKGYTVDGNKPGTIAIVGADGKLGNGLLPSNLQTAIIGISINSGVLTFTRMNGQSSTLTITAKYV